MRSVPEWQGSSPDAAIPPRVRLRVWERTNGSCAICTRKLVPGKWDVDHIQALVLGGQHREGNMHAVCTSPCHSQKTVDDVAQKSFEYKRKSRNAGIKRRKRTIPGRRFNGEAIPSRWK